MDESRPSILKNFATFEDFTGAEVEKVSEIELDIPDSVLMVGELTGIMYEAERDGIVEEYLHEFESETLPTLAVDANSGQLFIIGGDYNFNELGIVDN